MECVEAIDVMGEAVEGSLETQMHSAFVEHLDECDACRTFFEQLQVTRRTLGALPPGPTSPRLTELVDRFREEFRNKTD